MLYALAEWLSGYITPLNAFTYLTSRIILGALTALFLSLGCGGPMIRLLKRLQMGQYVRDDGPQTHLKKAGTTKVEHWGDIEEAKQVIRESQERWKKQ